MDFNFKNTSAVSNSGFYGCPAVIARGENRCREAADSCAHHNEESPRAPRPEVVLLRFALTDWQVKKFKGVAEQFRSWAERRKLEAERSGEAKKLGRKAYIVDAMNTDKDDAHAPESAHTGSPIFGENSGGLKCVNVLELEAELREAGFVFQGVSLLFRTGKPTFLVLAFVWGEGAEEFYEFGWHEFNQFIHRPRKYVHVWINGRRPDGAVVHTVNVNGGPVQGDAQVTLRYADGLWVAEPCAAAVTA